MSDDTIHCMDNNVEELRWHLVKTMLDKSPELRKRVKEHLRD